MLVSVVHTKIRTVIYYLGFCAPNKTFTAVFSRQMLGTAYKQWSVMSTVLCHMDFCWKMCVLVSVTFRQIIHLVQNINNHHAHFGVELYGLACRHLQMAFSVVCSTWKKCLVITGSLSVL